MFMKRITRCFGFGALMFVPGTFFAVYLGNTFYKVDEPQRKSILEEETSPQLKALVSIVRSTRLEHHRDRTDYYIDLDLLFPFSLENSHPNNICYSRTFIGTNPLPIERNDILTLQLDQLVYDELMSSTEESEAHMRTMWIDSTLVEYTKN